MKTKFLKGIITTVLLFTTLSTFAQVDPTDPEGEEDQATPASIDTTLPLLLIGGLALGSYIMVKGYKTNKSTEN